MATKSVLLRIALVALLLVAQHAALTHATWHAHDRIAGDAQHDHDANGTPDGNSPESQLCGFHLAFGQVLGAAGSSAVALDVPALEAERLGAGARSCVYLASLPPQSRGPPFLL